MVNKVYPVDQISEHSKDNYSKQLSNISEVLKRRRETKHESKNDEAIVRTSVDTTQSGQRNEDLSIDKPITAAPVDYSNQKDKKAMRDIKSGVDSSKRPNPN